MTVAIDWTSAKRSFVTGKRDQFLLAMTASRRERERENERLEAIRQENERADVAKLCQYANILTNVVQSTFKSDPTACKLLKHLIVAYKVADEGTTLADVIKNARNLAIDRLIHHVSSAVEHYQWVYELCGVLLDNLNDQQAPQLP